MRRILIKTLDILVWVVVLASVFAGAYAGGKLYPQIYKVPPSDQIDYVMAGAGAVGAFLASVVMFGMVAVLLQIEENTRRNRETFDALVRRAQERIDAGRGG